jgi:hypothetical protein
VVTTTTGSMEVWQNYPPLLGAAPATVTEWSASGEVAGDNRAPGIVLPPEAEVGTGW